MGDLLRRVRGRRGGVKTRVEEARRRYNIQVCVNMQQSYANQRIRRGVNFSNLINLSNAKSSGTSSHDKHYFVPTIMLSNTMSLAPKVVEVQHFFQRYNVDVGFITETWLKDRINDSVINISGYNIFRKDRIVREHGGVCIYAREQMKYEILENLQCCNDHEILWIKLNPTRLPRGFTCLIIAVIYHPPGSDCHSIINHLFQSLTLAESLYPNCSIVIAGDFNRLNVANIKRHFKLKQLVKLPTRGQVTLDKILTNMAEFFSPAEIYPPFGLSDHNTVLVRPKEREIGQSSRKFVTVRDTRASNKAALGRYLSSIDWASTINSKDNCTGKLDTLTDLIKIGLNHIMPEKVIKVHINDAPWMSTKLKDLIRMRQVAFYSNKNSIQFKFYRNAVNRERKLCKAKYYASKVQDLKGANPRQWWKEVKKISGSVNSIKLMSSLNVPGYDNLSHKEIADAINASLLEPLQEYNPLDPSTVNLPGEELDVIPEVSVERVYTHLSRLNKYKAPGPDGLSNWLFKEYAEILAEPVANILNSSFKDQSLPRVWKLADVCPLPKVKRVTNPQSELRPISLTCSLSKVAEEFIVADYIKPAVTKIIDPNQFGTIPGSSTVMALISMVHKWLKESDGTGSTIRVLLFDYRKAFDLIDHSTLIEKLRQLDIPNSVINWIMSFLSGRSQRVKLERDCFSEWGAVPAGVPQGTKLGPWLFLIMINDLSISGDPFDMWKYVDDTTVSELIAKNKDLSDAQSAVDQVSEWSKRNMLQLNRKKCKELLITFSRSRNLPSPVNVEGSTIIPVSKVKLLGVTINSTLTWNDHIEEIVKKASRKQYFLVQLKRAKVPAREIVAYYCACIRSAIDYACPVFHYSLPKYLQEDLERIQKRALACIYPGRRYEDALSLAGLASIHDHHESLSKSLFRSIVSDSKNKLHALLPQRNNNANYYFRKRRTFNIPTVKTKRYAQSFIMHSSKLYDDI